MLNKSVSWGPPTLGFISEKVSRLGIDLKKNIRCDFIHQTGLLCFMSAVMKTGESGLTVFRLLTKENRWKWVQANARLVYKNGKPDYIIATQRPLLYVHLFLSYTKKSSGSLVNSALLLDNNNVFLSAQG